MVDASALSDMGGNLVGTISSSILWGGLVLVVFGVLSFIMYWFLIYKKKFDIEVKIISNRAGEKGRIIFDKAAILKDKKSNEKFFRIWGLKMELTQPPFDIIQQSNRGDYIELYRASEDDVRFLPAPKISKEKVIRQNAFGKYSTSLQEYTPLNLGDEYWRARRNEENKSMFNAESFLMKILPYIPIMMAGVISIFILYVLFDNLPTVLSELRELVKEMRNLNQANIIVGNMILLSIRSKFLKWGKNE